MENEVAATVDETKTGVNKRFIFTLHDPEGQLDFDDPRVRIAAWQLEVGESGGKSWCHFQGYVVMKTACRYTAIKKLLGGTPYVVAARGTAPQCLAYVTKTDTRIEGPWFYPDEETARANTQGTRSDLAAACELIKAGASLSELPMPLLVRNCHGFQMLKLALAGMLDPAKDRPNVKVMCIHGPPGIGKTTFVKTHCSSPPFTLTVTETGALWGDGYMGQELVLLDDYAGQLPIHVFNQICDRWAYMLPIKGNFVPARWTTVFVLCNAEPNLWYTKYGQNQDVIGAVYRRIGYGIYEGKDPDHQYWHVDTREQMFARLNAASPVISDDSPMPDPTADAPAAAPAVAAPAPAAPAAAPGQTFYEAMHGCPRPPVRPISPPTSNLFSWNNFGHSRAEMQLFERQGLGLDAQGDVIVVNPQRHQEFLGM